MSKKRRGRKPHHRGGRVTPKGTGARSRPRHFDGGFGGPVDDHPLVHIAGLLAQDHPLALLDTASSMVWSMDPETTGFDDGPAVDPSELLDSLLLHDDPATTGLLGAFALLLDDELARRRCAREVSKRRWSTPAWFRALGEVTVTNVAGSTEPLGDGENVYLELRWPTGQVLTVVAYLDHNIGGVVKDAVSVPIGVDKLRALLDDEANVDDLTFDDVDAADTRARLEEAIDWSNRMWPPIESDTWPLSQPLLRWALRLLPAGGRAPEPREWSEEELAAIEQAFLASAHGKALEPADESLVEPIVWYGTGYGHGDPYRWGGPRVEILLVDWFPRKVVAPYEELVRLPDVLRAFIRWAHGESGIAERRTDETLAVIDEYERDYLEAIADEDRPQGVDALFAAMGVVPRDDDDWSATWSARMREINIREVGGEEAYEALHDDPLPDEPLALDRLPDDIRERVTRIGGLVDEVCEDFFGDVELRTACRRFLADAAAGDPEVFRRRSKDEPLAGAVCWVVAKVNRALGQGDSGAMLSTLGVKGAVSQRAQPLVRAVGAADVWSSYEPYLGTPRYLTSGRRRSIVDRREGRWLR